MGSLYAPKMIDSTDKFWSTRVGKIHMVWGIFNPNGPTLDSVGFFQTDEPGLMAVFHRWMHFTRDEAYVLGYVNLKSDGWMENYANLLTDTFSSRESENQDGPVIVTEVPSFFLHSYPDEWGDFPWALLTEAPAIYMADWGHQLYYIEKYGAELFDRAG